MINALILSIALTTPQLHAAADYCGEVFDEYKIPQNTYKLLGVSKKDKFSLSERLERQNYYKKLSVDLLFNSKNIYYCMKMVRGK